jgi:hypothetical protein
LRRSMSASGLSAMRRQGQTGSPGLRPSFASMPNRTPV